eukprot:6805592-Prymnesium_polylepis.2
MRLVAEHSLGAVRACGDGSERPLRAPRIGARDTLQRRGASVVAVVSVPEGSNRPSQRFQVATLDAWQS